MKPTLQWLRHAVQFIIFLFIIIVPLMSWYRSNLTNGKIDAILNQNPQNSQYYIVKNTNSIFRAHFGNSSVKINTQQHNELIKKNLSIIKGNTWSAELFGLSFIDPLGGLESILIGDTLPRKILIGVTLPVLVTLLFGRIFCPWICPAGFLFEMSAKLRDGLSQIGFIMKNMKFWRGQKYVLLFTGLVVSIFIGIPLLGFIYPPAVVAREVHHIVYYILNNSTENWFSLGMTIISGATLFFFILVLIEFFTGKRLWCQYLCPGGALYSLLGKFRLIRVQRNAFNCTNCTDCVAACPMGLNPMIDNMGLECDNCLACISSCNDNALSLKFSVIDKHNAKKGCSRFQVSGKNVKTSLTDTRNLTPETRNLKPDTLIISISP